LGGCGWGGGEWKGESLARTDVVTALKIRTMGVPKGKGKTDVGKKKTVQSNTTTRRRRTEVESLAQFREEERKFSRAEF